MEPDRSLDQLILADDPPPTAVRSRYGDGIRLVSDPQQFLRLLRTSRPALVVICAPPAARAEIEAVAVERRRRHDMRAVLIDPSYAVTERLGALRAGFDEALDESVGHEELAGRLVLLADEARLARSGNRITISPELVLDAEAHELRMRGAAIHLRPREYALLEVLARHPGRTFTRQQLLEAVGARTTIRDRRTIDVHVRWLREKLEGTGNVPARLVTVRGIGYRLERAARSVNRTLTKREQTVHAAGEN
jgi:DNA-binding response OmpR family regulator